MPKEKQQSLVTMEVGQSGTVTQILGGTNLINRLNSLGIRPGKRITKLSAMIMRGPVTIQVDGAQVAIGFGMARRIMIEVS